MGVSKIKPRHTRTAKTYRQYLAKNSGLSQKRRIAAFDLIADMEYEEMKKRKLEKTVDKVIEDSYGNTVNK